MQPQPTGGARAQDVAAAIDLLASRRLPPPLARSASGVDMRRELVLTKQAQRRRAWPSRARANVAGDLELRRPEIMAAFRTIVSATSLDAG